jgi:hypothetical protein
MKPNLRSFSMLEVELSGEIELSDTIIQQITKASIPDKDGDSVFYDTYKIANNSHVRWVIVSAPAKDGKTCGFWLHYELRKVKKIAKEVPSVDRLLSILSNVDRPVELGCLFRYKFTKRDKARIIVNLPLVISESPNLPFDVIKGLHLAKVEGKQSEYDVVLDRGQDGSLTETVAFRHVTRITDSLVTEVVKKAVEVSKRFVFKGE